MRYLQGKGNRDDDNLPAQAGTSTSTGTGGASRYPAQVQVLVIGRKLVRVLQLRAAQTVRCEVRGIAVCGSSQCWRHSTGKNLPLMMPRGKTSHPCLFYFIQRVTIILMMRQ